ncbi:hypothetical protein VTI74DRAFT_131 [Chaetomium olivicolor]
MAPTAASMASLTEFYLATFWEYKPKVVKRIIDELVAMGFNHARFNFDGDYSWFKVTCLDSDEDEIRKRFAILTQGIDKEAFEEHEDSILNDDDTLKPSFDNEWFSQYSENSQGGEVSVSEEPTMYSASGVWADLDENDEPYKLPDIVTAAQLKKIEEDTGVQLSPNLAGNLVQIDGHSEEAIGRAKEKLSVMLSIKHLLYAEDYIDPEDKLFAETRYLANIDPKLVSSTLIDRTTVMNLEKAYKRIYREGVSIRLCAWDPKKRKRFSLFGPKVDPRSSNKSVWESRSEFKFKQVDSLVVAREAPVPQVKNQVETWIEALPDNISPVEVSASHPDPLVTDRPSSTKSPSMPACEDLIDLFSKPSTSYLESLKVSEPEKEPMERPTLTLLEAQAAGGSSVTRSHTLAPDEDLISFLDEASTNWDAPQPATAPKHMAGVTTKKSASPSVNNDPVLDFGGEISATSRMDSADDCLIDMFDAVTAVKLSNDKFSDEIEVAMAKLLLSGPYRRGRVEVRAELGRTVLGAIPPSGLAFNNVETPSNGWEKWELIRRLKVHCGPNRNILFTRVLSTYASDVEDMINMNANGVRFWQQEPSRVWRTYSFHCALRSGESLHKFIVDITDDRSETGVFSYSIRPHDDFQLQNKPLPVYIHAVRRNWDVRIVMLHSEIDAFEACYGIFARTLLQSLSISCSETGFVELKFAIHDSSAVEVHDVRVLTKWRYPSVDNKSSLEIAGVEQFEMSPYSEGIYGNAGDSWKGVYARPFTQKRTKKRRDKGEFPRWFEASIISLELENLCCQNAPLKVGEKTSWDVKDLKARGIFSTLYAPALQMVRVMDHIGRRDDNRLAEACTELLPRPNDPLVGAPRPLSPHPQHRSQSQEHQERQQQSHQAHAAARASDGSSEGSGATSAHGAASTAGSTVPAWAENDQFVQFW